MYIFDGIAYSAQHPSLHSEGAQRDPWKRRVRIVAPKEQTANEMVQDVLAPHPNGTVDGVKHSWAVHWNTIEHVDAPPLPQQHQPVVSPSVSAGNTTYNIVNMTPHIESNPT